MMSSMTKTLEFGSVGDHPPNVFRRGGDDLHLEVR